MLISLVTLFPLSVSSIDSTYVQIHTSDPLNPIFINRRIASMFIGFDQSIKNNETPSIAGFQNHSGTPVRKIMKQIARLVEVDKEESSSLGKPEADVFWAVISFVNTYRLKTDKLTKFITGIADRWILNNTTLDNTVVYSCLGDISDYSFRNEIFDAHTDPWVIRWLICEFFRIKNKNYKICGDKLIVFPEDPVNKRSEFVQLVHYPAIKKSDEKNFKDVEIYYPYELTPLYKSVEGPTNNVMIIGYNPDTESDTKIQKKFIAILLGMLPRCRITVPTAYMPISHVINRNGSLDGITSLHKRSIYLGNQKLHQRHMDSINSLEVTLVRTKAYQRDGAQYPKLLSFISGLRLERVRLELGACEEDKWNDILDAIPSISPRTNQQMIIENLNCYFPSNRKITQASFERLKEYDVRAISLVVYNNRNEANMAFDILQTFKNLKVLKIFTGYEIKLVAERIVALDIETLVLDRIWLWSRISSRDNKKINMEFLEIILKSPKIKVLVISVASFNMVEIGGLVRQLLGRVESKVLETITLVPHRDEYGGPLIIENESRYSISIENENRCSTDIENESRCGRKNVHFDEDNEVPIKMRCRSAGVIKRIA